VLNYKIIVSEMQKYKIGQSSLFHFNTVNCDRAGAPTARIEFVVMILSISRVYIGRPRMEISYFAIRHL
jgi:hypothetical protein